MGPTEIGQELRSQREAREMTLQDVADAADCGVSTVCELELAKHPDRPLPPIAARVAQVFGLEIVATYALRPLARRGRR
jgi:transcriptional regulator with XRE-family HTH domain